MHVDVAVGRTIGSTTCEILHPVSFTACSTYVGRCDWSVLMSHTIVRAYLDVYNAANSELPHCCLTTAVAVANELQYRSTKKKMSRSKARPPTSSLPIF